MKKLVMSALILGSLFTVNKASAQKGLSVSVKATPQFSLFQNTGDNNSSNYNQKATFNTNVGVGAGYNFTNTMGIGSDVLYSFQGQRYSLNNTNKEYNQKNQYIKVPLYYSYNTNPSRPVSFIGKIGPQVSFITNSKLDDKDGNKIIDDTKDRYRDVTFGGMASAGAQYKLNPNLYLSTAIRFDYDFTNAEDDKYTAYPAGRAKTYNMTTGLEVGLKYMLGK